MLLAHRTEDGREQKLLEHLENTARLAAGFAKAFNNEEYAYCIGLFHDLGKYSDEFQNRLLNMGKKCDHSTAGAKEAIEHVPNFGIIFAYCIAGHHSGLLNIGSILDGANEGTLLSRLCETNLIPDYSKYEEEIDITILENLKRPNIQPMNKGGYSIAFLIRMLYSTLVDADFLDTEDFMSNGLIDRNVSYDFKTYLKKITEKTSRFSTEGLINSKRKAILDNCINKAQMTKGLFSLTVPTGGGKTLSSMTFAIQHLIKNKMDRIIYVIPYTAIIEQNAKVFKDIFGEEAVLEHHSNFDFSNSENTKDGKKNHLYLATENWDAPIIVTTNVQFFESLYNNRSSKSRKIHNIANSVIIFDEVQMLPEAYLIPCIMGIAELVENYNATAVLCSATQPALAEFFPESIVSTEIQDNIDALYRVFTRTEIVLRGKMDFVDIGIEMNGLNQCLCIVNTRKEAKAIYELLEGDGVFHLSSLMCPQHRKEVVSEIRERLTNNQSCRVVSTRLIEAGVDVDFPRVYRMIAGVDSIVQAAGRCNREGKLKSENGELIKGEVHVFEGEGGINKRLPHAFLRPMEVTKQIMNQFDDISTPEAIKAYFETLYNYVGNEGLDIKKIYKRLNLDIRKKTSLHYDFKTISDEFKLIEENTIGVIIPFNNQVNKVIKSLEFIEFPNKELRSLQPYTVNIYEHEFNALCDCGKIKIIDKGIYKLSTLTDYSEEIGLIINIKNGVGIYM